VKEVAQLLTAIDRAVDSLKASGRPPAVILTGDLNASPTSCSTGYGALAYETVKAHPFGYRSVLNDDKPVASSRSVLGGKSPLSNEGKGVWTTWKARNKQGRESVVKHCIDYILYVPPATGRSTGVVAQSVLDIYSDEYIGADLLPSALYPSDHLAIAADLRVIEKIP